MKIEKEFSPIRITLETSEDKEFINELIMLYLMNRESKFPWNRTYIDKYNRQLKLFENALS